VVYHAIINAFIDNISQPRFYRPIKDIATQLNAVDPAVLFMMACSENNVAKNSAGSERNTESIDSVAKQILGYAMTSAGYTEAMIAEDFELMKSRRTNGMSPSEQIMLEQLTLLNSLINNEIDFNFLAVCLFLYKEQPDAYSKQSVSLDVKSNTATKRLMCYIKQRLG
jgi:hypothetical protein